MARTTWTSLPLAALLALAPLAGAQPGPAPGQDPLSHTLAYAQEQADGIQADPAGYAAGKASVEGVGNETAHAAYVACWAAYDATGMDLDACAPFFTPPGAFDPPAKGEAAEAAEPVAPVVEDATRLAGDVLDAVQGTLEDPASAPSQLEGIVAAVAAFAHAVADFAIAIVDGIAAGVVAAAVALADGVAALADGVVQGASLAAGGLGTLASAALDGLTVAGAATAQGLAAVAGGAADGAVAAAQAVAHAAQAAADGVAQAAQAVVDAVASWFGAGEAPQPVGRAAQAGATPSLPATDGLLERVTGALPL